MLVRVLVAVFLCLAPSVSALPELEVSISHANGVPGQQHVSVDVYMTNHVDSVAAFLLWIQMDRPGIAVFQPTVDTVGTLCAGWEILEVQSLGGQYTDLKVIAITNGIGGTVDKAIPPQDGLAPLFRLLLDVESEPDPFAGPTVSLAIPLMLPQLFEFVRPDGQQIGYSTVMVIDTSYFQCVSWSGDSCLDYEQVAAWEPYDSVAIEESPHVIIDTALVGTQGGSLTVVEPVCGDIDGSLDGSVDVSDLTRMISYLMITFEPLSVPALGDVDSSLDGLVDIADLTALIAHLMIDFRELVCEL